MDFYSLSTSQKEEIHQALNKVAQSLGGHNFFLQLIEEIRQAKPSPLLAPRNVFYYSKGKIIWNKSIYKQSFKEIAPAVYREDSLGGALVDLEPKLHKATLNMLKTISPIEFNILMQEETKVSFKIFQNDMFSLEFKAIFIYPVRLVKTILSYKKGENSLD